MAGHLGMSQASEEEDSGLRQLLIHFVYVLIAPHLVLLQAPAMHHSLAEDQS